MEKTFVIVIVCIVVAAEMLSVAWIVSHQNPNNQGGVSAQEGIGQFPADFLSQQKRDSNRVSDLSSLNSAVSYYLADVMGAELSCVPGRVYKSTEGTRAIDGTGWLPVDFTQISAGSPLPQLPIDPINDSLNFYSYTCDPYGGASSSYEFNAVMESDKFEVYAQDDDGNNPDVYEIGDTNLLP